MLALTGLLVRLVAVEPSAAMPPPCPTTLVLLLTGLLVTVVRRQGRWLVGDLG